MPLNPEYEVRVGVMRVLSALNGLDYCVLRAASGNAKPVPGNADRLVVAGVDGKPEKTFFLRSFLVRDHPSEKRLRSNRSVMSYRDTLSSRMVDRHRGQILNQGSAAPHIQGLRPEADPEERFIEVVGVLDQEFIDVLSGRVGGVALRDRFMAVLVRIYVRGRSRKQDTLAGVNKVGGLARGGVEGDRDRLAPGAGDGLGVLQP